jgi:hypothetical protein
MWSSKLLKPKSLGTVQSELERSAWPYFSSQQILHHGSSSSGPVLPCQLLHSVLLCLKVPHLLDLVLQQIQLLIIICSRAPKDVNGPG